MEQLAKDLKYTFKNNELLIQALTHSSYAYENKKTKWNERLEFLGDAVLELSISDALYCKHPHMSEGDLTKLRAKIVCEASLNIVARRINLGSYLRLGRGEDSSGGRERDTILADALEAIFGAIFMESGYSAAYKVIADLFAESISNTDKNTAFNDYKTYLQEIIQKNSKEPILYKIIDKTGPSHDNTFTSQAIHNGTILGVGVGKSKKEAEQSAAYRALEFLKKV